MTHIIRRSVGFSWILVALGLALLVVENLPTHTVDLAANQPDDMVNLPIMYD